MLMNVNNISKFNKKDCYGCTACEVVCPTKAIEIKPDEEGFYYPVIDKNKCIGCSACVKVCNIEEYNLKKILNEEPKNVYAVWSKELNSVLRSTSGGASYHMAYNFIKNGGVVYGVVWSEHFVATHVRVDSIEKLDEIRGSKYVQSKLNGIFESVRADLNNNMKVLFLGTPCQVGGLKAIVKGKMLENLYTVDLVCHGTPSIKMFQAYISYLENKEKAKIVDFQCRGKKRTGWRAYEEVKYDNGRMTKKVSGYQPYFIGFYNALFSKWKCYDCGYSQRKRCGDVTLSDFWGSEKSDRRLAKERKFGYNLFSCNTEKGKTLLESVSDDMTILQSSYEIAVRGDVRFRHSDTCPKIRNVIYKELDRIGFDGIKKHYLQVKHLWIKRWIPNSLINIIREIQCRIK